MEYQEREQLSQFLQQLVQARAGQKDGEAESLIREACARQPDASYLLVQRALLQDHALTDARAQITRLQTELIAAQGSPQSGNQGRGFLADGNAWGQVASAPSPTPAVRPLSVAPVAGPQTAPAATSSWGSSFLGNVAATAAGVAAGSFLFQGIENLMAGHHGGHPSGSSQGLSDQGETGLYNGASTDSTPASLAAMDDFGADGGLDDLGPGDDWS